MSPEQQRICIAKACGWLKIYNANTMAACGIWVGYDPKNAIVGKPQELPDYLNDLNAMHAAEIEMNKEQKAAYVHTLELVAWKNKSGDEWAYFALLHATAAQRAEAFLRTIGKWKD